jgi:hypothetical protein
MKTPEDEAFEEIERIQRTRTRWVPVKKPQDEIIALGIQAGLCDEFGDINMEYDYKDQMLAFAKLVAEKGIEAMKQGYYCVICSRFLPSDEHGVIVHDDVPHPIDMDFGDEEVLRFVNSAIEAEREACAEICKKHADVYAMLEQNPTTQSAWAACIDNLDAIKARGKT